MVFELVCVLLIAIQVIILFAVSLYRRHMIRDFQERQNALYAIDAHKQRQIHFLAFELNEIYKILGVMEPTTAEDLCRSCGQPPSSTDHMSEVCLYSDPRLVQIISAIKEGFLYGVPLDDQKRAWKHMIDEVLELARKENKVA